MRVIASRWGFDPESVDFASAVYGVTGFRSDIPDEAFAELFTAGGFMAFPFGRSTETNFYAVRLVPGKALADSPVVSVSENRMATEASSPRVFVPLLALKTMQAGDGTFWDRVAKLKAADWKALDQFHAALGGKPELLDALRKIVKDKELKKRRFKGSRNDAQRVRAESVMALDPDAGTQAAFAYLVQQVTTLTASLPLPEAGAWESFVTQNAFLQFRDDEDQAGSAEAAWRHLLQPAGLDLFSGTTLVAQASVAVEAAPLLEAAKAVAAGEERKDPFWAVVKAMAAKGDEYDGAAHVKAAGELVTDDHFVRAFDALASGAFWQFERKSEVDERLFDRACHVARLANWADGVEALDVLKEARDALGVGKAA